MKNTIKLLGIIVFIAVIGFSFAACNRAAGSAATEIASSANELDALIDEYEVLVKEMVAILIAEGDADEVEAKLEALTDKMGEFEPTDEQRQRVLEITMSIFN